MPKTKPITKQELRDIEASVLRAVAKQTEEERLKQRWTKKCAKLGEHAQDAYEAEVALQALRFADGRRLNSPFMSNVLTRAGARNDIKFFIRVGKVLSKQAVKQSKDIRQIEIPITTKLTQFIIGRWTSRSGDIPELFYLTPIGLREVCAHCLKMNWLTVDAVVKLRQRLGLKPFKRAKIDAFSKGGTLRFRQLDK